MNNNNNTDNDSTGKSEDKSNGFGTGSNLGNINKGTGKSNKPLQYYCY